VSKTHELAPDGPLARRLSGFEPRAGQARMMELVDRAFRDDGVLAAEAGTGTGKTFAYLIPAVRWAFETGEKVVLSTHTIALQEQILSKDLPLVADALGIPIQAALLKGRGNYLCRRKVAEQIAIGPSLMDPGFDGSALTRIGEWAEAHEEGSRTELGFSPPGEVWDAVKSDRDSCLRTKCAYHQRCFYYRARRAAAAAQIVIANHHLVFADLAVKAGIAEAAGEGDRVDGVLPAYRRIIFDEAHHLETVAATWFGVEVSRTGLLRTLHRLTGGERRSLLTGLLPALAGTLLGASHRLDPETKERWMNGADRIDRRVLPFARWMIEAVPPAFARLHAWAMSQAGPASGAPGPRAPGDPDRERRIRLPDEPDERWRTEVQPALDRLVHPPDGILGLADELRDLRRTIETRDEEIDRVIAGPLVDLAGAIRALERASAAVEMVGKGEEGSEEAPPQVVRWVESDPASAGRVVRMVATPIDLAPLLAKHLFNAHSTVVLTSATLSANGDFGPISKRFGFDRVVEDRAVTESLPSPFDWPSQALVAVPTDLPAPDEEGFEEGLAERVLEAVLATDGGAFVLFTSYRTLDQVHSALASRLAAAGLPVLKQGDGERHTLLEAFRKDSGSVLFATESFWEGVDVPGDGLRNVVITRLPFKPPSDPVLVARAERLTAAGGNAFAELTVPQALITFRQGLGRLIRTRTDRGILVILDKRMVTRTYGRSFLEALPPCRVERGDSSEVFAAARRFLGR
jgi:ATP-dependent DNA helicase DinG